MLNPSNFDSSLLKRHIQEKMPLSYHPNNTVRAEENEFPAQFTDDRRTTNVVLPKIFPDVFSLSYYNTNTNNKKARKSNPYVFIISLLLSIYDYRFGGIGGSSQTHQDTNDDIQDTLKLTSQNYHSNEVCFLLQPISI